MSATAVGEVEWAACECCGLREECTPAYIARVRDRHGGRWVCGLCSEAVEDEIRRSGRRISPEEALTRHASFREAFRLAAPPLTRQRILSPPLGSSSAVASNLRGRRGRTLTALAGGQRVAAQPCSRLPEAASLPLLAGEVE
ncbi:uncharacterized protein LOC120282465 [Dioscorea cayenensis subsp. rotundata]|uniref:Uncharacterized protein LOC120282465 n=1 Tax=Dioscorea cayennensis subsp. rotundata TaxID=55577 RepID=A0AB40D363_DIOCR|nr:uncharacterized protein LOC120282465 [Dioscorea cayenensis subsp. rotundata]